MTLLFLLASFVLTVFAAAMFQTPEATPVAAPGLATGESMVAVGALALFLGIPVKGIVDIIKGATGASGGKLPVIGVFVGMALALLVQLASSNPMTIAITAQCFFAGLSAQLAAMASTTLQTKAEESRDKSEADAKKGN